MVIVKPIEPQGAAVGAADCSWEVVEKEWREKVGDDYQAWRVIAMQQTEEHGEVAAELLEIAGEKNWLKDWLKTDMKSAEHEQALKRCRANTLGDAINRASKSECASEPGEARELAPSEVQSDDEDEIAEAAAQKLVEEAAKMDDSMGGGAAEKAVPDDDVELAASSGVKRSTAAATMRAKLATAKTAAPTEAQRARGKAANTNYAPAPRTVRASSVAAASATASTAGHPVSESAGVAAARRKLEQAAADADMCVVDAKEHRKMKNDVSELKVLAAEAIIERERIMFTTGAMVEHNVKAETYRNLVSCVKKKGEGNGAFHNEVWPIIMGVVGNHAQLCEAKARFGLGKIFGKTEGGARQMQMACVDALRKAYGNDIPCTVIIGKGEVERARDEQMSIAYGVVCRYLGAETKDQRNDCGLTVGWPDASGRWFYGISENGRLQDVMIAGHNDCHRVVCEVMIYDEELHREYAKADQDSGQNRFILQTLLLEVDSPEQMLEFGQGRKQSAAGEKGGAKGQGRGSGSGGRKGQSRGNGGGGKNNYSGGGKGVREPPPPWTGNIRPRGGAYK